MNRYIMTTPPRECTPQQWLDYVASLRRLPETAPDSKAAKGIKLHVQDDGRLIIRCSRDDKQVSLIEVANLAIEYSQDEVELYALLTKRGFKITNETGEQLNAKPKSRKRTARKAATKADAHIDANLEQSSRQDQLFQS
jgi:hypothetical protein